MRRAHTLVSTSVIYHYRSTKFLYASGGACIDALALPIFYNKTIAQQPVDLTTVSTQYATAGANFVATVTADKTASFFLYPFH